MKPPVSLSFPGSGVEFGSPRFPLWAAVLIFAFPSAARAQDGEVDAIPDPEPALDGPHDPLGLGLKKLAYALTLKVAEVFDDNIFLTARDRTSDFITVLLLSARVRYDYGSGAANLAYRGRERLFARHDEFDGLEHFLDASAALEIRPVRFEGGLEWRALKDPFDVLQSSDRVDSRFDRVFLKSIGDFGRLDVELTAGAARFTVDDEILDRGDYRRMEFAATGLVEAWPQVSLLGEVGLRESRYDDEVFSDFTVVRFTAGARGSLTAKTRTEARVGYARAEPHGDAVVPTDGFSGLVASVTTTWAVGEKQEVRLELRREPVESVLSGLAIADEVRIGCRATPWERWTAQAGLSWEHRRESDRSGSRQAFSARAGAQWALGGRIHADTGVLFRARSSDDSDSDYESLRISLGIGVQW